MVTRRGLDLAGFLTLHALLALGGYVTLRGIGTSQVPLGLAGDPTPLGYTRSLVLFLLPCLVFGYWLLRLNGDPLRRKAFFLTVGALFPLGALLDLFLGYHFFRFPNGQAVLGSRYPFLLLPAYDWANGFRGLLGPGWRSGYVPIEEILFYGLGFTAILLTYLWCESVLFGDRKADLRQQMPRIFRRWWSAAGLWFLFGVLLYLVALRVSRGVETRDGPAFPGYFLFLLVSAILPSMVCFRIAQHFVHWRALTVAWLFLFAISQFWEAALALPYQWWDYKHSNMVGIFLRPHCDLPIEAALVWSLASWTTAIIHETILAGLRLRAQTGASVWRILRGEVEDLNQVKRVEGVPPSSRTVVTRPG